VSASLSILHGRIEVSSRTIATFSRNPDLARRTGEAGSALALMPASAVSLTVLGHGTAVDALADGGSYRLVSYGGTTISTALAFSSSETVSYGGVGSGSMLAGAALATLILSLGATALLVSGGVTSGTVIGCDASTVEGGGQLLATDG
jgi:hypothetical protein